MGRKQVKGTKENCPEGGDEGQGEIGKEQKQTSEDIAKDHCLDIEALAKEIEGTRAAKKAKGKKKGAKKNNVFEDVRQESEELSPEKRALKFNKHTTEVDSVVPPKPEKTKKKGKKGSQYEEGDEEEGQGDMEKIRDQKDQTAPPDSISSGSGCRSHQKTMQKTDKKKKGPSKAAVKHIKDTLAKLKEEEERVKREEEEERKRLEEQEQQRLELERLEQARKEKKRKQEKERIQRLKKEGKFLTKAQKEDRARAEATLEILQAQGVKIPSKDSVPKNKPVYGDRRRKKVNTPEETSPSSTVSESPESESPKPTSTEPEMVTTPVDKPDTVEEDWEDLASSDDVSWEALASSDEEKDLMKGNIEVKDMSARAHPIALSNPRVTEGVDEGIEKRALKGNRGKKSEQDNRGSEGKKSEQDSRGSEGKKSEQDSRGSERSEEKHAENINLGKLRAPVVCVLGHVDTGKTKILDKLRHTRVQDGEAGGITQQIGATNVPLKDIREQTKMVPSFDKENIKIPGMLLIDTPGHEPFRNLRNRGSSLCDIAILVVDIMHGLEKQTLESIHLLREKNCPFIVALNKIDRLIDWEDSPLTDIVPTLTKQKQNTKDHFDRRTMEIIEQFTKERLNAALFHKNKDPKTCVSLVPTSAHTGDGIGNLIALLVDLAQTRLVETLAHSDKLNAHVLEVKTIPGIGTTIDVILINGSLSKGENIIVPRVEGSIVTKISRLLLPPPMKELRVTNQHVPNDKVCASQGVRIVGDNLKRTLAGLPLFKARKEEIPLLKKKLDKLVMERMNAIAHKKEKKGVYVQASTMGSLEALLDFLHTSKVPYAGVNIGAVLKSDITNASAMKKHDPLYAVILAFDVKVERDIEKMAEREGVRVFSADTIYNLLDEFTKYREDYMKAKQEESKHIAVFPVKLKILPRPVFRSLYGNPILLGVTVEDGILRLGTPLCVPAPAKGLVNIGIVTSIEANHKPMDSAKKDQQVCVKIKPVPGESPEMVGRRPLKKLIEESDCIVSKICRESIDALKNWFRDDMANSDWNLIRELKVTLEIT